MLKVFSKCSLQMYAKPKIKKFPVDHVNINYTRVDECTEECVLTMAGEARGGKLTVNIGSIPVEMKIDSGASANVISQASWEQLKNQLIKCVSRRSTRKLYAYGAVTRLEVIGTFTTDLSLGSKSVCAEASVIKGQKEPLLGRESAVELGALK